MKVFQIKIMVVAILLFASTDFVVLAQSKENEAVIIFNSGDSLSNLDTIIKHSGKDKNIKDQAYAMKVYTEPLTKKFKNIKMRDKYAINNFIVYGTKSTKYLSAKERHAMLISYKKMNKKLPLTEDNYKKLLQQPLPIIKCQSLTCIIETARSCQKSELLYKFNSVPVPILEFFGLKGMLASGESLYKIENINNARHCQLKLVSKKITYKISSDGQNEAIKAGIKKSEINSMIQQINNEQIPNLTTICTGTAKNISTYIEDNSKGNSNMHCTTSHDFKTSICKYDSGVTCVTPNT